MIKNVLAREPIEAPQPTTAGSQEKIPRLRLTIRAKITLPFLLLAIGLAIGAAYIVARIVFDTIDERFLNQLIDSGKRVSEAMVRRENELITHWRLYAYSKGMADAVAQKNTNSLHELSLGIAANGRDDVVAYLDMNGDLIFSMRRKSDQEKADYEIRLDTGVDYRSYPFIKNILQRKVDHFGDKYSGVIQEGWAEVFYIAGPVYDSQRNYLGVALVGSTLPSLLKQLYDETLSQVTFYDRNGKVIASTFGNPADLDPDSAEAVLAFQDDNSLRRNLGPNRILNISEIDYQEILGPWEVREDEDLGIVGTALPYSFLVHASIPTRMQVTGFVSLMILLVIVVGLNIAGIITRPIRRLVVASTEVAKGDLSIQVKPEGHDEIAILTQSFNHMVASLSQSKLDLLQAYDSTLEGWSTALELRDRETEGHTRRVTDMTLRLARVIGIGDEDLVNYRRGALLHDIGKMGIPDSILQKPGQLTPDEWAIMRKHPLFAYHMLWPIEFLRPAIDIPYCHHERWDGTGYPRGLRGEAIPLAARIFAIVDVWDAMCSDRPYRTALPQEVACEYIFTASGNHFDPLIVDAFFDMMARIPCEASLTGINL